MGDQGEMLPRAAVLQQAIKRPQHTHPPAHLLTISEACAYLRISKWSLYRQIQRQQLKSVKIGKRRLIRLQSIIDFLQKLETGSGA